MNLKTYTLSAIISHVEALAGDYTYEVGRSGPAFEDEVNALFVYADGSERLGELEGGIARVEVAVSLLKQALDLLKKVEAVEEEEEEEEDEDDLEDA